MVLIIRDDALPRFKALASLMRWHYKYAGMTVEELWRNSQAAGASEGSAEDIVFWCDEAAADEETRQRLLAALQNKRVNFISKIGDDLYKINGNRDQIDNTDHRRETNRENARRRWAKTKQGQTGNLPAQSDSQERSDSESQMPSQSESECESHANRMQVASEVDAIRTASAMPKLNVPKRTEPDLNEPKGEEARTPARVRVDPPPSACELCGGRGVVPRWHAALGERLFACSCPAGASPPPGTIGRLGEPSAVEGWSDTPPPRASERAAAGDVFDDSPRYEADAGDEPPDPGESCDDLALARWFQTQIVARNPFARRVAEADLSKWAQTLRQVREEDGFAEKDIRFTIEFALDHSHWGSIVLSPEKLRAKWDEITADLAKDERKAREKSRRRNF